jgi:trans-2,3-dihydro-3-hydroxyanthranilate isomerase
MDPTSHPAPTLQYFLLDVFTEDAFSGNPLAVFVDPLPLSDGQMQRIAAELHLSETVFIWSPARAGRPWRTRIFTPAIELPFAGHPTVGAAFLLAGLGRVAPVDGHVDLELDEAVGTVAVTVSLDDQGVPATAELVVPQSPVRVETATPEDLALVVGLDVSDFHSDLPVRGYSAGTPFTIIPVADAAALSRARVDGSHWEAFVAGSEAPHLYLITPVSGARVPPRWRARMFAPAMEIAEDPATGAAAAAFGGYLLEVDPDLTQHSAIIEQGVEMGRPSRMQLSIASPRRGGSPFVTVGGPAVVIGNGTLAVPRARV